MEDVNPASSKSDFWNKSSEKWFKRDVGIDWCSLTVPTTHAIKGSKKHPKGVGAPLVLLQRWSVVSRVWRDLTKARGSNRKACSKKTPLLKRTYLWHWVKNKYITYRICRQWSVPVTVWLAIIEQKLLGIHSERQAPVLHFCQKEEPRNGLETAEANILLMMRPNNAIEMGWCFAGTIPKLNRIGWESKFSTGILTY